MSLLFIAVITGSVAWAACGDDDGPGPTQSVSPTDAPTPTSEPSQTVLATPTATATAPSASAVRTPTVYPSPPPIPDDWLTFSDPGGLFVFRYPPDWTTYPGSTAVFSFDTAVVTPAPGYGLPQETVKVEVTHNDIAGSTACGSSQLKDPSTGQLVVQPGAAVWTLGGMPGYLWVYGPDEGEGGTTLIPSVTTIYKEYCFGIAGYFTQTTPDVQTFLQIAASFQFTF